LAKYTLTNNLNKNKGHRTLLILPLTIITLFCFGYTFAQSKSYQASKAAASKQQSEANNTTSPINEPDPESAAKLETVEQPTSNASSSPSTTSPESKPNTKASDNSLLKKVNESLKPRH
jgi:hypothetical protein